MRAGPNCGHETHVDGCGPCEAGLARLRHMVDAHGLEQFDCPHCGGDGCATCGDGVVFKFPVRAGACPDGDLCLLRRGGEA